MSGQPVRTNFDASKFRREYLDTLKLQSDINEMNYQANQIYIKNGVPSTPTDQRTTDEKLQDLYRLRIEARSLLGQIMSGNDANNVAEMLNEDEIRFLVQQQNVIIPDLKKQFKLGVPADVFLQYLREYMRKFQETTGVDAGVIQNLIPRREQIEGIRVAVNNLGGVNVPMALRDEVNANMDGLGVLSEDILRVIREAVAMENAMLREDIFERLNEIMEDIPTQADLDELLKKLSIANQKRDSVMAEGILSQMATMTQFAGGIQEDLALLNKKLEEAGVQAVPIPAQVFAESETQARQATALPNLVFNDVEYYQPIAGEVIVTLNKGSKKGEKVQTLEGYIRALNVLTNKNIQSIFENTPFANETMTELIRNRTREDLHEAFTLPIVEQRINELYSRLPPPLKKGDGVRMKGKGVVKAKIDYSAGIMKEPDYVPFGKFIINRRRLGDGVCMIKRLSGQFMPDMKTKRISPNLTAVFKKVAGGSLPNFSDLEKLDDDEREYLKHISNKCHLSSKLEVPSPKKDKSEMLINKFEIMRGQLIAGNDSKDLIKNFKKILIEMNDKDLLPKSQARDILLELARLEI